MGIGLLERLERDLVDLDEIDVQSLGVDELTDLAVGLARCQSRLHAATSRAVGTWEQQGAFRSDGSRAAWARLSRAANLSTREAQAIVRRAKALRAMPGVRDALARGDISAGHVDLLAKATSNDVRVEAFPGDEQFLVQQCVTLRFNDAKQVVQYWCQRVDPEGCERAGRDLLDTTSLTVADTLDGCVHVTGLLDPVGGAAFREALRRIENELRDRDGAADPPVVRSRGARRAAALVEMALRASASTSGRRPEPLVCVLAGTDTMSRLCELSTGQVITPGLVVPYLTSSEVQSFVFGDAWHVLGVSNQRTFTGWLRRAIQMRDRHCTHPAGCDASMHECDVDHIIPYAAGGLTSQENGRLQCPTHNRNADLHLRAPPDANGP